MRIDNIKEQNYKGPNPQGLIKKNKYSSPVFKQTNYELYFKSLNSLSDSNRLMVKNNRKAVSFTGATELISFTDSPLVKALGHYANIDFVKALYRNTAPELVEKIDSLEFFGNNKAKIRGLYHEFASRNLFSLGDNESPQRYTTYWTKNKKLGDKNLVEFWLSSLGLDINGKNPFEKTNMLNGLSTKQRQWLIDSTVRHWISEILPVDLDKANRNDIKYLQAGAQQQFVQTEISVIRPSLLSTISTKGIEHYDSVQLGGKNLVDFWIDLIDGEKSTKGFSSGLKKRRLLEIINSDEDLNKIYSRTIEEAGKGSQQIKKTQEAIKNLVEDSALDAPAQALLETYQNSQLFFQIVNHEAKNKNSIVNLEISTKRILDELAHERRAIVEQARANLFDPLKEVNYLLENPNDTQNKVRLDVLSSIMDDKMSMLSLPEQKRYRNPLDTIRRIINANNVSIKSLWEELKKQIYDSDLYEFVGHYGTQTSQMKQKIERAQALLKRENTNYNLINKITTTQRKYDNFVQSHIPADIKAGIQKIDDALSRPDIDLFSSWADFRNKFDEKIKRYQSWGTIDIVEKTLMQTRNVLDEKIVESMQDIKRFWIEYICPIQEHFENIQVNRALDEIIKKRIIAQEVLHENPSVEIQQALQSPQLDYEQKAFVARYKDDANLSGLLKLPNIKVQEDINSLLSLEQTNEFVFDSISSEFRNNLSPEAVKQIPEFADAYLKVLGFDCTKFNAQEKYDVLSKVPLEELEMASVDVKKEWSNKFLSKVISDSALEKVRSLDVNINTARIADQLGYVNLKLDNIIVQLQEQQYTLGQIANKIDNFIDIYQRVSTAMYERLGDMAQSLEDIHADTSNIRTNVKAMLFQSIQSTRDSVLREEMKSLLQDADRMELSEFIRTVDAKQQKYKEDHKFNTFCAFLKDKVIRPALFVGGAVGVSTFAPHLAPFLISHGLPAVGHLIASQNLGHAVNTAVQCQTPGIGFTTALLSGGKLGA